MCGSVLKQKFDLSKIGHVVQISSFKTDEHVDLPCGKFDRANASFYQPNAIASVLPVYAIAIASIWLNKNASIWLNKNA